MLTEYAATSQEKFSFNLDRPPAEKRVKSASEQAIAIAYQIFIKQGLDVEHLIGYEGNAFAFTGNIEKDILGIAAVHPIREEGLNELLKKAKADWAIITILIEANKIKKFLEIGYPRSRATRYYDNFMALRAVIISNYKKTKQQPRSELRGILLIK